VVVAVVATRDKVVPSACRE